MAGEFSRRGDTMSEIAFGQQFGLLTVLEEAPRRNGRRCWVCRCDCGNEKVVDQGHLRSGHTKSCGCLSRARSQARAIDLTGRRFGRLTAITPTPRRRRTSVIWHCRCDCGAETYVESDILLRGNSRSCGCIREEQRKENMKKAIHFENGTCIEKIACQRECASNTSGHRGVTRRPNGKWRAELTFRGKRYHLGYYDRFEDAVKARLKGEEMYTDYLEAYYAAQKEENPDP